MREVIDVELFLDPKDTAIQVIFIFADAPEREEFRLQPPVYSKGNRLFFELMHQIEVEDLDSVNGVRITAL